MQNKKVIVVGAGASGLAAAYRLQQAGCEVVVLEAADKIGGRVQSLHKNGYLMDLGADVNTTGYLTYLALTRELGLESAMTPITSLVGTVVGGEVRHMDVASAWSMATTPTYSLRTKLRLLRGMKKIAPDLVGIDYRYLHRSAHLDDPHRSAESYGLRHFGAEATDYMIDPLTRLVHTTGAELTSILDVATALALSKAGTWTFLGGANRLLKAMAEKLTIRFQARVEAVRENGQGVTVTYRTAAGETIEARCSACVLALMYEDVARIHPPIKDISSELWTSLRYLESSKIHIGYAAPTRSKAFTIQIPSVEDSEAFLMFLDHNKAPDRAPPGHSLINIQTDLRFAARAAAMSDEELVAWARGKAEKYFPELVGHFSGVGNVTRWPRLGNMNYPGYYRNVARFVERLDQNSRIQLAGDMFTKTSQEGAATWGERAADNVRKILDLG